MYKSFFYICLLLPFFLVVTGCNDSSDDTHAESSLTMGLIFPLSDPKGKPRHHAALLASQHLTGAGYPIKTVVADSGLSPFVGVEAARKLVENGNAKVLIGASSSSVTMEIAEWVSIPNKIPQISYASTSPEITDLEEDDNGDGFLFRTAPSDKLQGAVLAYLAKEIKGYDKVAIVYRQDSYGENLSSIFRNEFQSRGGIVDVEISHEAYSSGDFDLDSRIKEDFSVFSRNFSTDLDAIVVVSYKAESDIYVKLALEEKSFQGIEFLFVDGNKGITIFADGFDKHKLDDMCGTISSKESQDDYQLFEEEYEGSFGSLGDWTYLPNTYDAVIVAGLAAYSATQKNNGKEIKPIDISEQLGVVAGPPGIRVGPGADNIRKALKLLDKGESINYDGASSSIDFNNNGDLIAAPFEIWCYNNGQIKTTHICEVTDAIVPEQVDCKKLTATSQQ